jgi:hypothetical protein
MVKEQTRFKWIGHGKLPDNSPEVGLMVWPPHTNDHFLTDTTKDEKWLVLVGRPSLAASRWRGRRPTPPSYFHIKLQSKNYEYSCHSERSTAE